ncbi:hypothetical protein Z043_121091 [Scleropages formosus]|uniref:Uncharacterized protein n=1 Tax=Scleropages formosus TaxID=113540 RepID=A0A0P7WCM8_SCLFO|nr:hypothetical protein Z043_121091 [Scleropages formosus]
MKAGGTSASAHFLLTRNHRKLQPADEQEGECWGGVLRERAGLQSKPPPADIATWTIPVCNFMSHEKCLKHVKSVCSCMGPSLVRDRLWITVTLPGTSSR